MFQTYGYRFTAEDRDVSRAAAERYLMLQAVSHQRAAQGHRRGSSGRWHPRRLLRAVAGRL